MSSTRGNRCEGQTLTPLRRCRETSLRSWSWGMWKADSVADTRRSSTVCTTSLSCRYDRSAETYGGMGMRAIAKQLDGEVLTSMVASRGI